MVLWMHRMAEVAEVYHMDHSDGGGCGSLGFANVGSIARYVSRSRSECPEDQFHDLFRNGVTH